jgi:hypothetical protein
MNHKLCGKCREEKNLDQFAVYTSKSGKTCPYFICKDCKNDYQASRRKVVAAPVKRKHGTYVAKVWPIAGDAKQVAATFLDSEFNVAKAILRENGRYFMASANGKLPARFELLGIFNCNMPYRDLVQELAA